MHSPSASNASEKSDASAETLPRVQLRTAPLVNYAWIGRWSDIALIIFFALVLALPLLGSFFGWHGARVDENRSLAAAPDLRRDRLQDLPAKIDAYYTDHVGFRAAMVEASALALHRYLQSSSDRVVLGRVPASGEPQWLFYASQGILEDRLGLRPLTQPQLNRWRKILERRQAWMAARGILYLYVVVPEKSSVYPEFLPDYLATRVSANTRLDQLVRNLKSNRSPVHFIDLRDALIGAKSEGSLYFAQDTHWNGRGFFVGYREMLNAMQPFVPELEPQQLGRDYEIRTETTNSYHDLANMLGLPIDAGYSDILQHRGAAKSVLARAERPSDAIRPLAPQLAYALETPGASERRLLVFHDSFLAAGPLTPEDQPLALHFRRSYFARIDADDSTMRGFVDLEHPNVVLEEHAERTLGDDPVDAPLEPVTPALKRSNDLPTYYLDSIDARPAAPQILVAAGRWIPVIGWAVDRSAGSPAGGVEVVVDGVPQPAAYGYQRTDVAAFFQQPAYLESGFELQIPPSALPPGQHTLDIRVISADGKRYSQSTYGRIIVAK